jgi:hypothetical protein
MQYKPPTAVAVLFAVAVALAVLWSLGVKVAQRPPPPPERPPVVSVQVRTWTSCLPPDDPEAFVVEVLRQARKTVHVRADDVASPAIAQALVDARARGCVVKALLCRRDGPGPSSQLPFLRREQVEALALKQTSTRHCYAVVDAELLLLGGLSGEDADDSCLVIRDRDLALRYQADWQRQRDQLAAARGLN